MLKLPWKGYKNIRRFLIISYQQVTVPSSRTKKDGVIKPVDNPKVIRPWRGTLYPT